MFICVNKTDTLAWMWKTKLNKSKTFNDIRLYMSGKQNKDDTLMWLADNFFYDDNIANYRKVSFKMCCSPVFMPSETKQ